MKRVFDISNAGRLLLFLLINSICSLSAHGQKEGNIWIFGHQASLDFNSGSPVASTSQISQIGGSASICDENGQLLFYTDGRRIYNKYHALMPNGLIFPYMPGPQMQYTTQAAVIAQVPGSDTRYYVFSLETFNNNSLNICPWGCLNSGHLYYSIVEISMNSGLGDIVPSQKGVLLHNRMTEKMTVVKGDGCSLWLITRSKDSTIKYLSYQITSAGLNTTPVNSIAGNFVGDVNTYSGGNIQISPNRKKMVVVSRPSLYYQSSTGNLSQQYGLELYDFNDATGIISNPVALDTTPALGVLASYNGEYFISACFSPDNSKLYATYYVGGGIYLAEKRLYQFDLSQPTPPAIIASRTLIASVIDTGLANVSIGSVDKAFGAMKIGPDGRIYMVDGGVPDSMHTINQPNIAGAGCQFTFNSIAVAPSSYNRLLSLPNEVAVAPPDTFRNKIQLYACFGDSLILQADTPGRTYQWENGLKTSTRTVYNTGVYTVHYKKVCEYHIDSFFVVFNEVPASGMKKYSCANEAQGMIWLNNAPADTSTYTYTWTDAQNSVIRTAQSNEGDTLQNLAPGNYSVDIKTLSGCDTILSFTIDSLPVPNVSFNADSLICINDTLHLQNTSDASLYTWFFGAGQGTASTTDAAHVYKTRGDYEVSLVGENIQHCKDTATTTIQVKDLQLTLVADKDIVNKSEQVKLETSAPEPYTIYAWQPEFMFPNQQALFQNVVMDSSTIFTVWGISGYGCKDSGAVQVSVYPKVFMPTAFSPNGDGLNDRFRPLSTSEIRVLYLYIYNRWGELMYQAYGNSALAGWDGTYHGAAAEVGTYFYYVEMDLGNGRKTFLKGDVSLVR